MKKIFATFAALLALAATLGAETVRETYVYSIKGADTLRLDTYVNDSVQVEGKRPVMIYVHGGGFTTGSRKNVAQEIYCNHFADMGFLAASIDYRLAGMLMTEDGQVVNPYNLSDTYEAVKYADIDLIDATNFLIEREEELNIDRTKIIIAGGSAGAITVLTTEYDLCNGADYTKVLPEGFDYAGVISQAGAVNGDKSPIEWARKPCPMLLFFGSEDALVPTGEQELLGDTWSGSRSLDAQLGEMGVPHWTYEEVGADHVLAMSTLMDNNEETDKFVRDFVLGGRQASVYTSWKDAEPKNMADINAMLRYVPMYILGYGCYMEEMQAKMAAGEMSKPDTVLY